MAMKKAVRLAFALLLVCVFGFSACDTLNVGPQVHTHVFGEWTQAVEPTCTNGGVMESCCECGEKQTRTVEALGHAEVIDPAIPATCSAEGKTEGKHCSRCGEILSSQATVDKVAHDEVIDAAISVSCTTDGKTEGRHCGVCGTVLVAQTVVPATGHVYDSGEIITEATCNQDGEKKYTCTAQGCDHSYTEAYALPTYTATELYELSVKYVGEIITYDKQGAELALGTGFVISSDGKIVTNYHVIEGACSAEITIDGKTYAIASVLAYDATIDLAVLKVNARGMTAATVCKEPVNVGETVYAIGSSRGMTNTYSQGIITYADRVVDGVSHVQHDASITNGNSGGPLINAYGEVVGINSWLISNSQNLNFAVFAGELDNLVYGTPMTLEELYAKEYNTFERLKAYIIANGTYLSSDDCYCLTLGTAYPSDRESTYTRLAFYYVEEDKVTMDLVVDDGVFWAYFIIDEEVDGVYLWEFFAEGGYEMSGTFRAATFNSDTLLSYSDNNISSSSLRSSARELASALINLLCVYMDNDLAPANVTAEDLGFNHY